MEIIKGKMKTAIKTVIYGVEGIGKSTFASHFPEPLFIDTEGSTKQLDIARLPLPKSYEELEADIRYAINNPTVCKTLIIDTIDWAELLIRKKIITDLNIQSIEDVGYGKGYTMVAEKMKRLIEMFDLLIEKGVNVVLTAHAQIKTFSQPDGLGQYDRYEMKLSRQSSPLVKEWADLLLFANYKTIVIKNKDDKAKGTGGERVIYTSHKPAFDAKNRYGLPEEMKFDFNSIKKLFDDTVPTEETKKEEVETPQQNVQQAVQKNVQVETAEETKTQKKETKPIDSKEFEIAKLVKQMADRGIKEAELKQVLAKKNITYTDSNMKELDEELLKFLNNNIDGLYSQVVAIRNPLG